MTVAHEALERLREGNQRFVEGRPTLEQRIRPELRESLVGGQAPFAAILGCADSRAPAEILFDQGLGDLFVVRVAGNVIGAAPIGSLEYAVSELGVRLIVVLGHTRCGAVGATVDALQNPPADVSPHLGALVERIRPAVEPLLATDLVDDPTALAQRAVRDNVKETVRALERESAVLAAHIADQGLRLVGGEYALETGIVDFFDNPAGDGEG